MCTFGITAVSKPPPTLRNEGLNHIVAQEAGIAGRLSTAAEAFFKMPISHQTQVLIGLSSCGLLAMRGNSVCVPLSGWCRISIIRAFLTGQRHLVAGATYDELTLLRRGLGGPGSQRLRIKELVQ